MKKPKPSPEGSKSLPRIPMRWYRCLRDPWKFYEHVKSVTWYARWLIGYADELENKAKVVPDDVAKRIKESLRDVSDDLCGICNAEIGDYTPKDEADRKKDLKNIGFRARSTPKPAVPVKKVGETRENTAKMHENMQKIVQKSRKKRKNRRNGGK